MKAVILAAGQGTRLRPVTLTMPKPLVPVANKPLLGYAIDVLKNAGLTDIGIVVSSLDSPIPAALGDGASLGVNLEYLVQEEQLGLAHAVGITKDFVGDEPFCVMLGDNIFHDKMESLLRGFPDSDSDAAIALYEVPDPTRFGLAVVEGDEIVRVVEKPKDPPSNLAICGVYLFKSSIFEAIDQIEPSARGELEITDAIQVLVSSKRKVQPYVLDGWWIDAGKPDAIINAQSLVLGDLPYTPAIEDERVTGDSFVSHRVVLGENSKIIDSVVRGPTIIGDNVTIRNAYIGPYSAIGDNVTVENTEVEASIIMDNCVVKDVDARIDSSLIANGSTVTASPKPSKKRLVLAEESVVEV